MEIFTVTIPIFIFVAAGYALRRKGIIGDEVKSFLGRFVYYFAFPALTFRSIVSFDFAATFRLPLVALNITVTGIVFVVTFLLAFVIKNPYKRGAFNMGCFRSNQGYLGLPAVNGFYGGEAMSRAAVINGFDSPIVIILSVLALEVFRNKIRKTGSKPALKIFGEKLAAFALNPFIISSVSGLILAYCKIPVLDVIVLDRFLEMAASMALPLALLSIGCSIDISHLRKNIKPVISAAFIKLIIMPAIAFTMGYFFFGFRELDLGMSVILVSTPSSVSSYVMACEMGTDHELSAAIIGFTTLISAFTMTVVQFALLQGIF